MARPPSGSRSAPARPRRRRTARRRRFRRPDVPRRRPATRARTSRRGAGRPGPRASTAARRGDHGARPAAGRSAPYWPLLVVVFGAVTAWQVADRAAAADDVVDRSQPLTADAASIYRSLADADTTRRGGLPRRRPGGRATSRALPPGHRHGVRAARQGVGQQPGAPRDPGARSPGSTSELPRYTGPGRDGAGQQPAGTAAGRRLSAVRQRADAHRTPARRHGALYDGGDRPAGRRLRAGRGAGRGRRWRRARSRSARWCGRSAATTGAPTGCSTAACWRPRRPASWCWSGWRRATPWPARG